MTKVDEECTKDNQSVLNNIGSNSENYTTLPEMMRKSALQDNIESKGKNAYYFAHAHRANGPKWDGKPQPRLLAKHSSSEGESFTSSKQLTFDIGKSTISKYAFLDEGKRIKIYVELMGVGEKCSENDISLEWTESSFCLVVKNYHACDSKVECLRFGKLHGLITKVSYRKKTDRIILCLIKKEEGEGDAEKWPAIAAKGDTDHGIV